MTGDIKSTINILKYPKIEKFESITKDELLNYIKNHESFVKKFNENQDYYIGKNTFITSKKNSDPDNPDSRIAVSYARTMTQIVKGYMYKPNSITYTSENELYLEKLEETFEFNNEPLITSELGENQSKYGIAIELLYIDRKYNNVNGIDNYNLLEATTIPYMVSIDPQEVILLFDMNTKETLIGAIRYYIIYENEKENIKKYRVDVFFKDRVEVYEVIEQQNKKDVILLETYPNYFNQIPFCYYRNNTEMHADYEPIKLLLDAYDTMVSDSINEMNRFSNAYLILKNYTLYSPNDVNEKSLVLEKLKTNRIFQFIGDNGGAEFLTKSIPSDFFNVVKQTLREDIQYHSHIPDFRAKNFENASGISLLYSLFDFENLCADKQALFEVGLRQRINLINNFFRFQSADIEKVDIKFSRNIPTNITEKIDNFVKLANTAKIADEDLYKILPKEIMPNIEEALDRIKKQKEENMAMFDFDTANTENEDEEDNNLNKNNNNLNKEVKK